ncbi:MAG TPA: XdhC family protein [Micromonosporaceae bacterium]|nr:XdhC family protein [Micromonosporaceae bacterium]
MSAPTHPDPACAMARGDLPPEVGRRRIVAVFITPVTEFLLHFARDLGWETVMMDPDAGRLAWAEWRYADQVISVPTEEYVDRDTDVVVTDHDREELGQVLESFLRLPARWIGVMGSVRHAPAHVEPLRRLGVPDPVIARIRRPIGLNIGSQTPAEIAIATLAGLIADRNRRPGGFAF